MLCNPEINKQQQKKAITSKETVQKIILLKRIKEKFKKKIKDDLILCCSH